MRDGLPPALRATKFIEIAPQSVIWNRFATLINAGGEGVPAPSPKAHAFPPGEGMRLRRWTSNARPYGWDEGLGDCHGSEAASQ